MHVCMYIHVCIYIYIYIYMHTSLGAKACTPEINTSEIIVDFRGVYCAYFPKDRHFSSGFSPDLSNGCSVSFSDGISLL